MPPEKEAFLLVEERRLVIIHFLEDGSHQRLAEEPAAIRHAVPFAETLQGPAFTLVEQNGYSIFARRLLHHIDSLEIERKLQTGRYELTTCFIHKFNPFDRFRYLHFRLLELDKENNRQR